MEWSKVKNILIVIFLILNVSLLILVSKYSVKSDISNDTISNALIVLNERGVKISCDLIDENLTLGTLSMEPNFEILKIVEELLEDKINEPIVYNRKYQKENKTVEYLSKNLIRFNHKLKTVDTPLNSNNKDDFNILLTNSSFKNLKFKIDKSNLILKENQVIYRQVFKEYFVFDNYIEFDLKNKLEINARISYKKVEAENFKKNIMPIYQVLLKNFTGDNDIEIVNIELGYKGISLEDGFDELVYIPVWRLITKTKAIRFFRAYGGEEITYTSTVYNMLVQKWKLTQ